MRNNNMIHVWQEFANGGGRYTGYWHLPQDFTKEDVTIGKEIKVENDYGGYHYHNINEKDEFEFEADQAILTKRYYRDDLANSEYGWIDLDGVFYGCTFHGHNDCAFDIFGVDEQTAEQAGNIKLYYDITDLAQNGVNADGVTWYCSHRPNHLQKIALRRKGFEIE